MKKEVGKEWEGYKTKIHRRPAAGESRDNEKQRVATEVSLRPSVVGKYPEGADPVPCNRPECLRKDNTMCETGDLICEREIPGPNPHGETGEDAPSNVEFMHWMCVTPRARVMLRKNPERMIFDEDLTEEEKAAVLSDIAKARNKRAFSDLEG
ncbi:hypothetical protein NLI96_g12855 [Meripilus lineatus]|uniref:PARP-type domain-containing protein n=1 Tax=Meripilus lineatus TaxID=2056292 RepID=A0AAD5URI6_9APHY|nr:hypothetical protein NLI96_g12855 [Physisporinus lineatus]